MNEPSPSAWNTIPMPSTSPRIALLRPIPKGIRQALTAYGDLLGGELDAPAGLEEATALLAKADAAFVTPQDQITEGMLRSAPRLRVISSVGAGLDHIDLAACAELSVQVRGTPDETTEPTADLVFALVLAAARNLVAADAFVRDGSWTAGKPPPWGVDVHHKTIGIVGFGRIGKAVARRSAAFSMPLVYHNRAPLNSESLEGLQARWCPLPDLLREADVVVIQVPLTPETRGLIGAAQLDMMKRDALLIVTGRGGVVDEEALVSSLRAGGIGRAALDVFDNEPAIRPSLLECPNLTLTPHVGTLTLAARQAMLHGAVANLASMLAHSS